MRWPETIINWGSTAEERSKDFGCEPLVPEPDMILFRAVDVEAPAATTFRWLCQMRAAPYSYDKLDNLGRRSPQQLTPGLEQLEVGQRINTIFKLTSFEPSQSLTMYSKGRLFGATACTYQAIADPLDPRRSRIVAKLVCRCPRTPLGLALRAILPAGDLVMMRRQLLNLAGLAARSSYSDLVSNEPSTSAIASTESSSPVATAMTKS